MRGFLVNAVVPIKQTTNYYYFIIIIILLLLLLLLLLSMFSKNILRYKLSHLKGSGKKQRKKNE